MTAPIWTPSTNRISESNLTRFQRQLSEKYRFANNYQSLWHWSVSSKELFWKECAEFCGVNFSDAPETTYSPAPATARIPRGSWFPGGKLNFAEHLLRAAGDKVAIVGFAEGAPRKSITFEELRSQVAAVQQFLLAAGVNIGDRVGAFLPNCIEAVVAMLATTGIGAVWSSTSPDFGVQGVIDRFAQIEPKVLFVTDGYYYGGKIQRTATKVRDICQRLPSLEKLVVVNHLQECRDTIEGAPYRQIVEKNSASTLIYHQLPFDQPAFILYSSGTTGVPKCIVHGAGGTLMQHLKELVLHTDLRPDDRIIYTTTCGWMMWNWLVSSLAVGATIYLYDGSLFHPEPSTLIKNIIEEEITIFGTGAKYLMLLEKHGVIPSELGSLENLRTVLSTGSPLPASSYSFVYNCFKRDLCLSSISGGTDIISCFALGNPTLPVYPGELQSFGLGMEVEVLDDSGKPVRGQPGELCCKPPFPSMPVSFWNDQNDEKYYRSYFERFPGIWKHGDWAEISENSGLIIHGRSDATLNPGGVRIGTAEIYRVVETLPEILESVVTAQKWESDERIILFVKLRPDTIIDTVLKKQIADKIRQQLTPRHVPAKIIQVKDIPRTLSGKIVELAIRETIHGRDVTNKDALANPEALEYFKNLKELKGD